MAPHRLLRERCPGHVRHVLIGDDNIESLGIGTEHLEGLGAPGRECRDVA